MLYFGAVCVLGDFQMNLDLTKLLAGSTNSLDFEFRLTQEDCEQLAQDFPQTKFDYPIVLSGNVSTCGDGTYDVNFSSVVGFSEPCARCAGPAHAVLNIHIENKAIRGNKSEESEDYLFVKNKEIDVVSPFFEQIVLEYPQYGILCKEDCKGLCPVCGIDLNKKSCNCRAKTVDPRLAKLSELLKQ